MRWLDKAMGRDAESETFSVLSEKSLGSVQTMPELAASISMMVWDS